MARQTVMVSMDAYVDSNIPDGNRDVTHMWVGGGTRCWGLAWAQIPVPAGATVLSARLVVAVARTWDGAGPVTVEAYRLLDSWAERKVTYASMPAATARNGGMLVTSLTRAGDRWSIDVTRLVQDVVDGWPTGRAWGGFRLQSDSATPILVQGRATKYFAPRLELEWSLAPRTPAGLSPDGGAAISTAKPVFACDFYDGAGDTTMSAMQVRTFESWTRASGNYGAVWDSLVVETVEPEVDTAALAGPVPYPGAAAHPATTWWRCRVRDGAGLWSEWSDPATFSYAPLETVGLVYPVHGQTVGDATPQVTWTHTGTQRAWRVYAIDLSDGTVVHDTRQRLGAATQHELPAGALTRTGGSYRVWVETWDPVERMGAVGAADRAKAYADFTFEHSAAGSYAPLAVEQVGKSPLVDLMWTLQDLPEKIIVIRDGYVIAQGPPAQFGTHPNYSLRDAVAGWAEHSWQIRAIRDGGTYNGGIARLRPEVGGIWLVDPRRELEPLALQGREQGSQELGENTTWHETTNGRRVMVSQALGKLHGVMEGVILAEETLVEGVSSAAMRERAMQFRKFRGQTWWLVFGSRSITVTAGNFQITDTPDTGRGGQLRYRVSFEFAQV